MRAVLLGPAIWEVAMLMNLRLEGNIVFEDVDTELVRFCVQDQNRQDQDVGGTRGVPQENVIDHCKDSSE